MEVKTPAKVTPLWIVAAFVTLTEAVLGIALTQVTGGVQVALTVFVISFALLVAGAFFVILWNRPYVFYPPSEYGDIDPQKFMSAIRDAPGIANQVKLVKSVSANPGDKESKFKLIDSMADEAQCQWVIFMHESGKDIPRYSRHVYELGSGGGGTGQFDSFGRNSLEGTGLIEFTGGGGYVSLTEEGHLFAQWLLDKGRKGTFFWSPVGGWGKPSEKGISEKWLKENGIDLTQIEAEPPR